MAIKPSDGDTFIREVDEELRRERINQFVTRYGWALIAAVVLLLAAIGGLIWWRGHQEAQAGKQGEALLKALDSMESGNRDAAMPTINELAQSDAEGYRVAALFARANAEIDADNEQAAIATLREIAGNEDFAQEYRDAALVRQTVLEYDSMQPQAVVQRLRSLARPGQAWFGTAGEMVGIAFLKMGRNDQAGQLFAQIARDETVPPSIRTRAVQMAGALGVSATDEPAAPGGAAPAADGNQAATREKAE